VQKRREMRSYNIALYTRTSLYGKMHVATPLIVLTLISRAFLIGRNVANISLIASMYDFQPVRTDIISDFASFLVHLS
jgi:hypothetical protein